MAYTLRIPLARNSFCTGLKKSQKASQVFGASDSVKPAFLTKSPQMWNGYNHAKG
jgi:hypothetical protein